MKQLLFLLSLSTLFILGCDDEDVFGAPGEGNGKDLQFLTGEWSGEFNQDNFGIYPMEMEVQEVDGQEFSGELRWPTLGNSITTMEGSFRNDTLFWTEPVLLQGYGIVLNGQYIVPFVSEDELSGEWFYRNQPENSGGSFTVRK